MNWFKKSTKDTNSDNNMEEKIFNPDMDQFKKIFVSDEQIGGTNSAPKVADPTDSKPITELLVFMNTDYLAMGNGDGYAHHNSDFMYAKIEKFKGEFDWLMECEIERLQMNIEQLELMQSDWADDQFKGLFDRCDVRMQQLLAAIQKAKLQMDLSAQGSGVIAKVFTAYKEGFLKGAGEYTETALFAKSTGLFN